MDGNALKWETEWGSEGSQDALPAPSPANCRYARTITLAGIIEETPIEPYSYNCRQQFKAYEKVYRQQPYQLDYRMQDKGIRSFESSVKFPNYTLPSEPNTQFSSSSSSYYSPRVELVSPVPEFDPLTSYYPDSPRSLDYGIGDDSGDGKPLLTGMFTTLDSVSLSTATGTQYATSHQQPSTTYTYPKIENSLDSEVIQLLTPKSEPTLTSNPGQFDHLFSFPSPSTYPISMSSYNSNNCHSNNVNSNNVNSNSNNVYNNSSEQHYWPTTLSSDSAGTTITPSYSNTNTGVSFQNNVAVSTSSWATDSFRQTNEPQICLRCGTTKLPLWQSNGNIMFMCMHCKGSDDMKKMQKEKLSRKTTKQEIDCRKVHNHKCTNCGTANTTLWRRNSDGEHVCNACGLYHKLRGVNRPMCMRNKTIAKRKRKPKNSETANNVNDVASAIANEDKSKRLVAC